MAKGVHSYDELVDLIIENRIGGNEFWRQRTSGSGKFMALVLIGDMLVSDMMIVGNAIVRALTVFILVLSVLITL